MRSLGNRESMPDTGAVPNSTLTLSTASRSHPSLFTVIETHPPLVRYHSQIPHPSSTQPSQPPSPFLGRKYKRVTCTQFSGEAFAHRTQARKMRSLERGGMGRLVGIGVLVSRCCGVERAWGGEGDGGMRGGRWWSWWWGWGVECLLMNC